ncbi:MAG: type II toxin-antitoxin system RelE/ParE family toxin [Clostridiales bacterium]|nr:type II toxin-antitoxin system RelE/ParE family toxin [Clostridiales bacterium]
MKNKLHYSPDALRDLDEIWEYIQVELSNPSAAANVVNDILDTLDRLEDFAEMGAPLSSVADVESNYRFIQSGNYLAFYRPEGTDIYIDRILYGRRDYLRILFDK